MAVILVVDDESAVRRLACQLLVREGYTTLEAEDGREALELLSADPGRVALVLSDIRMPRLNGLQLEQAIREAWPWLPVILMSGEVTREWIARLARETRVHSLRKPFVGDELLERVRELLASHPDRSEGTGG